MVTEKMVELYAKVFDYELFSVNYNADEMVELWNKGIYDRQNKAIHC